MSAQLAQALRMHARTLRTKSMPLSDLIPLLNKAADALAALEAAPQQAQDKLDAERWRTMLARVGATSWFNGGHMFMVNLQAPPNVMQGSVAQHFTAAIDAARKAQP